MKTKITLLTMAFLISLSTFSQQGINYKALVKDNLGNVVANQTISVQLTILEDATVVYTETHTPITNANGLIILNIGTGTTGDVFDDINWGNNEHFLKTEIDISGGTTYTDLGTTQFMAVPYALNAANVTGLEALDEGNGNGWRLKGRDLAKYGDIGLRAIDLSYNGTTSTTHGATGYESIATGYRTIASNTHSTAMGSFTTASGENSTAMGNSSKATGGKSTAMGSITTASGFNSTAMGSITTASGNYSTAMGRSTKAESYSSTAIGRFNIGGGTASSWLTTDPLFEIGNGFSSAGRTNALTILKNGTIIAPTFDLTEITDVRALTTKEYVDIYGSSGLQALNEGNGVGHRIKDRDPTNYGNIGQYAVDLSFSNVISTTGATGLVSTAFGGYNTASGIYSTAMGNNTLASGYYSTSLGGSTKAEAYGSTAIGFYNVGGGTIGSLVATDPLFEVGNGADDSNRDNALTVLKNGKVGIGEHQPSAFLEIKANNSSNAPTVRLIHEGTTGARINFTNTDVTTGNYWTLYGDPDDIDANSVFNIYHPNAGNIVRIQGNGNVGIGTAPSYRLDVRGNIGGDYAAQIYNTSTNTNADGLKIRVGRTTAPTSSNSFVAFFDGNNTSRGRIQGNGTGVTYATTSDRRLKTSITDITDALTLIDKIQPRQYEYKTSLGVKEYGFIAQELQPLYAQAVIGTPNSDVKKDPMMVDYGRLTPILTAGIKELNKKVTSQEKDIKILKEENAALKVELNRFEQLEARLSTLETALKTEKLALITKQ